MIDQLLQQIGNRFFDKGSLTAEEKQEIKKAYRQITGENLRECGPCYAKAYEVFKNQKQQYMDKQACQFKLIPGKKVMMHGIDMIITENNLSDHNVFLALKKNSNVIKFFAEFPADWREQAEAYNPAGKAAAKVEAPQENTVKQEGLVVDPTAGTGKSTGPALEERQKLWPTLSAAELKKIAEEAGFPKAEFEKLGQKKMVAYLMDKIKS